MTDPDGIEPRLPRRSPAGAVATLVRVLGDIDLAEEAVQEAFAVAIERWPADGPAAEPGRLDHHHRPQPGHRPAAPGGRPRGPARPGSTAAPARTNRREVGPVRDDQLRLIFTCCHPALAPAAQVALTLRLLGGLETPEIARAFLVPEATMAQRMVRAKRKIKDAGIPYRIPTEAQLPDRLPPVLAVALPGLQRGVRGQRRRELVARRPVRRGDPAGPRAGRADAGRARGRRPARAAAADRVPPAGPDRAGRRRSCCCPTRTARCGTAS